MEDTDIIITKHAETRLKERCGLNKKSIKRISQKAFNNGLPGEKAKGELKKWTKSIRRRNEAINNVRIYGDKIFLFDGYTLITVLQIPYSVMKQLNKK